MNVPWEYAARIAGFPATLRALIEAELAAGNEIAEVASCFPAPPAGAYVRLSRPVSTRPRASGGGVEFYDRNTSTYSGEFTDAQRFFFVLEPPHPPEPEPDRGAIRASRAPPGPRPAKSERGCQGLPPSLAPAAAGPQPEAETAVQRFERSMILDYEKWHDGVGYDLGVLRAASPQERAAIESLLIHRGVNDWRDVEALAEFDTPRARKVLKAALKSSDHQVRSAVTRYAPKLVSDTQRGASLVRALEGAEFYGGLSETLDEVATFHPPQVIDALFRGVLSRDGEAAVHFSAMLMFLHGKANDSFDWEQRPFFLKFHTKVIAEREAAFRELCEKIGVDSATYLKSNPALPDRRAEPGGG